ncbi:hypothetical protein [Cystobacter fuscus]|uniref:hypothetical protein n=1 Tax=Cystobacter fuscus TaxID=43 RepID=UPI002B27E454|nr:hypothetical protein F0U63_03415 [Cystobacter fuscus]
MANIAITGAGQAGLFLGVGLLVMTRGEGAILELLNPDGSVGLHIAPHQVPAVAAALIDGLYDPRALFPWFVDPAVTRDFPREAHGHGGMPPRVRTPSRAFRPPSPLSASGRKFSKKTNKTVIAFVAV